MATYPSYICKHKQNSTYPETTLYLTYLHSFSRKIQTYTDTSERAVTTRTHTAAPISISTTSRSHYENPQGGGNPFTRATSASQYTSYPYKVRDDNRAAKPVFLKVYAAPSSESAESM